MEPPYLRIAAEIRRRVETGELAPGDRAPSTRQITKDWGVALATATKALQVLTHEGLLRAVPRVGTVVASPEPPPAHRREAALSRDRIVRAAVEIADVEGMAALSMRGVAAKLGVATMAPYRHVAGKDELILLMIDATMGEDPLPTESSGGWRARLEAAARLQWRLYRRHPWLAQTLSLTRPQILPNALNHAEWMLTALDAAGIPKATAVHLYITVFNYVRGTAVNLEWEREAESATGLTEKEWMDTQEEALQDILASGEYPVFTKMNADGEGFDLALDDLFEFGLLRLLDGMESFLATGRQS